MQEPFPFTMPTSAKAQDQYISTSLHVSGMKTISPSVTLPHRLHAHIAMMPVCGAQVREISNSKAIAI